MYVSQSYSGNFRQIFLGNVFIFKYALYNQDFISEQENVHMAKHMVVDMKANLILIFRLSREILQPLYEVARLNSKKKKSLCLIWRKGLKKLPL